MQAMIFPTFSSAAETITDAPAANFANIVPIKGQPRMRAIQLAETGDGKLASGMWDCTAGTLDIIYGFDEIIHVLEGEVTITSNNKVQTLRAGDVALLPMGLHAVWEVPHYIRKIWVMRHPKRNLLQRVVGKLLKILGGK